MALLAEAACKRLQNYEGAWTSRDLGSELGSCYTLDAKKDS